MEDRLSERIKKSVEKASKDYPDEYASLLPEEHVHEPDPDTEKQYFSKIRNKYEHLLDGINESVETAKEFHDIDELKASLVSLNQAVHNLNAQPVTLKRGFFRRMIRKLVLYGIRPELDEINRALSDITRTLNSINHKTQIFAGKQESFNSQVALYGQYIVPLIDEKTRFFVLKKHLQYLKDRMDVFHENIDLRHTEISNWLHNLVKRLDSLENELVRGLSLQHKKLERLLIPGDSVSGQKVSTSDIQEEKNTDCGGLCGYSYYLFETRGRGSEEFVKKSQLEYVRYFKTVHPVIDLGCGRGEFLELLREAGIEAGGADINSDMVEICLEKKLEVIQSDALRVLMESASGTLGGIFAGQLVEHLTVSDLERFLKEAYRALKDKGIIVFETVNTTSLYALVHHFFKDPTHQMPRHPDTYKFLTETAGFTDVKIQFKSHVPSEKTLQIPDLETEKNIRDERLLSQMKMITENLNSMIYAPCDIAVIARKRT
jgi:ubiquinone/menaquinone biosynthesis C-methylase UbiE/uncharacterized protein YoxC